MSNLKGEILLLLFSGESPLNSFQVKNHFLQYLVKWDVQPFCTFENKKCKHFLKLACFRPKLLSENEKAINMGFYMLFCMLITLTRAKQCLFHQFAAETSQFRNVYIFIFNCTRWSHIPLKRARWWFYSILISFRRRAL